MSAKPIDLFTCAHEWHRVDSMTDGSASETVFRGIYGSSTDESDTDSEQCRWEHDLERDPHRFRDNPLFKKTRCEGCKNRRSYLRGRLQAHVVEDVESTVGKEESSARTRLLSFLRGWGGVVVFFAGINIMGALLAQFLEVRVLGEILRKTSALEEGMEVLRAELAEVRSVVEGDSRASDLAKIDTALQNLYMRELPELKQAIHDLHDGQETFIRSRPATNFTYERRRTATTEREVEFVDAVRASDWPSVVRAVEEGWDVVNARVERSKTTPLIEAARSGHYEICEFLLEHGAEVDARDGADRTALHAAAEGGQLGPVSVLVAHKADVNAQDKDGLTPLHVAAVHCKADVVQVLLGFKAKKFLKTYNGELATDLSCGMIGELGGVRRDTGNKKFMVEKLLG